MGWEIWVLIIELVVIIDLMFYTLYTGISPVPTTPRVRATMLAAAPVKISGSILELGSGWGSLAFSLARKYPQQQIHAYELSRLPWFFSRLRHLLQPLPNLHFHRQDYRKASFSGAMLVFCYLFPKGMQVLRQKFERELLSGCQVISNTFAIEEWNPAQVCVSDDQYASKVFRYLLTSAMTRPSASAADSSDSGQRPACENLLG